MYKKPSSTSLYLLEFNWYRAITQCTHPVNVLTKKLGIKIVRKCIPTRRSVAFLQLWQTVGWIKMPLGKVVGLGPGHIVLDGDPVGTQPPQQPLPTFGPCLLWPNGRPSQQLLSSCGVHIGATWRIRLNRPCMVAMRPYVKLL